MSRFWFCSHDNILGKSMRPCNWCFEIRKHIQVQLKYATREMNLQSAPTCALPPIDYPFSLGNGTCQQKGPASFPCPLQTSTWEPQSLKITRLALLTCWAFHTCLIHEGRICPRASRQQCSHPAFLGFYSHGLGVCWFVGIHGRVLLQGLGSRPVW